MYQWKENVSQKQEGENTVTTYDYEQGWFQQKIDSSGFKEQDKQNPPNAWPFQTETMTAQNVTMGKFRLNNTQVAMLGKRDEVYQWEDEGASAINATADTMANCGMSHF